MGTLVSSMFLSIQVIRRKLCSHALMAPSLIVGCLLGYVMPLPFQRCMTAIFSDFIENIMEVFMDDFSVYGGTFDLCLENLTKVLHRCEEVNLVLN